MDVARSLPRAAPWRCWRTLVPALLALVLAACAGPGGGGGGGYYQDDGPGRSPPSDPDAVADATPRAEPLIDRANRPYTVFGRRYVPMTRIAPYRERGTASWYGRKFHGNPTSSGEPYDMYAMTAASPTLPIPSYVRVTNLANGRQVVVRVNDRGPFLNDRLIDLSWTAAAKLGFLRNGHTRVEVELLDPSRDESTRIAEASPTAPAAADGSAAIVRPAVAAASAPAAPVESTALAPTPVREQKQAQAQAWARTQAQVQAPSEAPEGGAERGFVPDAPGGFVPAAATGSEASAAAPRVDAGTTGFVPAASADPASGPAARVPPAAPPAPSAPAEPSPPAAGPRYYLQLGAYQSLAGAQAALARLGSKFGWLSAGLDLRQERGLYKIHAGPWPGPDEADRVARRIRAESTLMPFTVRR